MRFTTIIGSLAAAIAMWCTPSLAADEIVVGFATAASGFMQAYDKPAQDAALIRIDEINKAGGLLGKKIKAVFADTKTDQAEGAKAGLTVLDQGADLVIVSCDYDYGAPAALQAQSASSSTAATSSGSTCSVGSTSSTGSASSTDATSTTDTTSSASSTSSTAVSSADASLQASFDNLVSALGGSSGATSLSGFLQAVANNLQGPSGNFVNTQA